MGRFRERWLIATHGTRNALTGGGHWLTGSEPLASAWGRPPANLARPSNRTDARARALLFTRARGSVYTRGPYGGLATRESDDDRSRDTLCACCRSLPLGRGIQVFPALMAIALRLD